MYPKNKLSIADYIELLEEAESIIKKQNERIKELEETAKLHIDQIMSLRKRAEINH